jgi:CRP-like cAMP-binding protein
MSRRGFGRGTSLFHAGDRASHIFVIETGSVKVFSVTSDGSESVVAILGPRELAGELHGTIQTTDALALERGAALAIPVGHVRQCLEEAGATHLIVDLLAERLRRTTLTLHGVICGDSRQRVAARLCDLADHQGRQTSTGATRLGVRLTQEDLGRMTGSSRETVNKVLALFSQKGWIEAKNGRYAITDEIALRELAGI